MRNKLLIALSVVAIMTVIALVGHADNKSLETIGRISSQLHNWGSYRVTFEMLADEMVDTRGEYTVDGNRYHISIEHMEQMSDGKSVYQINHAAREVVIDDIDTLSRNILNNPTRAFDFGDTVYDSHTAGLETIDGRECTVILLTPSAGDNNGFEQVRMWVDRQKGLPVKIIYEIEQTSIEIRILSMAFAEVDSAQFKFNATDYPNYEIVDFR